MTTIELNEEEIKILIAILNFSIAACPLEGISTEIEIDADKIEKLVTKMEKSLS